MSDDHDIEEIRQLKARYFRLMDTKDWEGLARVFADDVRIDMRAEGGGLTSSAAEYVPFVRSALDGVITVHHGHMPEVRLTSPTSAEGIWALEDQLWWPEGSPIRHMHGYGHYHETYVKGPDGWRIATMTITRLHRIFEMAEGAGAD